MRVAKDIFGLIGQTPMVRLNHVVEPGSAEVWTKLESMNPGGSVKDRAALGMVLDAERRGVLRAGGTICEATLGNTGVGLALVGVQRGYSVRLFMPEGYAEEKAILMRALGATVERIPEAEGMTGAIKRMLRFERQANAEGRGAGAFAAMQFENPANPDFHEATTGVEILEQMDGWIDALVIGVGSAGTFTGVVRAVRKRLPSVLAVAVESEGSVYGGGKAGPHRVEGIGASFVPATFDRILCNRIVAVTDAEAFAMVRRLALEEGLLTGSSAGANVAASVAVAKELGPGKRVVTVVPDSAERYLSTGIFEG